MKKTRFFSILLALTMVASMIPLAAVAADDVTEIVLMMPALGAVPSGVQEVEDAINAITVPEAGVKVSLNVVTVSEYVSQLTLMIAGGEDLDIALTLPIGAGQFSVMYGNGQLMDITGLLAEYGQGILTELDKVADGLIKGTSYGSEVYGVTSLYNKVASFYWLCRGDILEKYNINIDDITSMGDIEEILVMISENEPDMIPLMSGTEGAVISSQTSFISDFDADTFDVVYYDTLGSNAELGMALLDDPTTVVSMQEYELNWLLYEKMHDWYTKGLIYQDAAINQDMAETAASAGNVFSFFAISETGVEASKTAQIGYDIKAVKISSGIISTAALTKFVWAIPSTSKNSEAAMKVMNLMYTDPRMSNLMAWGVEGRDYVVVDGVATYPEGVTAATAAYHIADFFTGNQFNVYPWEGNPANLREIAREENQAAPASPLMGFSYDSSNVTTELTALANVMDEYLPGLKCGMVDPAEVKDEYLAALESAGLSVVLADMQGQLDAFWANSGN